MKICLQCGKQLKIKIKRDEHRKKFCSRSCLAKYYLAKYHGPHSEETKRKLSIVRIERGLSKGKNNPRYIDGRRMFRQEVLDSGIEYRCAECDRMVTLIAHHIEPCERKNDKGKSPGKGNHNRTNGVFLCYSCHKLLHNKWRKLGNVPSEA